MAHLAHSIAAGAGLAAPFGGNTGPSAMIGPVYPGLVYVAFTVFGQFTSASMGTLLALQCLFSALICPVTYHIGARLFGPRTGALAAWLWAASPAAMLVPAFRLWDTCLGALLFALVVLVIFRADASARHREWFLAGFVAGLSALVNPVTIPPAAALFAWAYIRRIRRNLSIVAPVLLSTVAVGLVLGPWILRNYVVFHRAMLRSNFGLELWMGNHDGSHGHTEMQWQPGTNPEEFAVYARMGELPYFQAKREDALRFIRKHPRQFVRLTAWRIGEFWTGWEDMWGVGTFAIPLVWLGLIGLVWMWRTSLPIALAMIFYPLPYYVTHPDTRFRHPLEPLLCVLAAEVVARVLRRPSSRARRSGAAAAL